MTNYKIMESYCNEIAKIDVIHVENCKANIIYMKEKKYNRMEGCPSSFGLEDYVGLCERENADSFSVADCSECWKEALHE